MQLNLHVSEKNNGSSHYILNMVTVCWTSFNFPIYLILVIMICHPSQQGVYLSSSFTLFFQFVLFGVEILKLVPGRVSTEVDARSVNLSYNKSRGIQTVQTCLTLSSPGFKRQVLLHCSSLRYTILFGRPQIYQVNACLQIANSNKCTVGGFRRWRWNFRLQKKSHYNTPFLYSLCIDKKTEGFDAWAFLILVGKPP